MNGQLQRDKAEHPVLYAVTYSVGFAFTIGVFLLICYLAYLGLRTILS